MLLIPRLFLVCGPCQQLNFKCVHAQVLMEVPALVCEADLHCAQTALTLVRGACLRCPAALTPEARHALTPNILALAKSPLLQGPGTPQYFKLHAVTKSCKNSYSRLLSS